MSGRPALDAVVVGGATGPWARLGFSGGVRLGFANGAIVVDDDARPGMVALRVTAPGGTDDAPAVGSVLDVDGVMCEVVERGAPDQERHPNGAIEIDHVVVTTDALDRTSTALAEGLGLPLRRVREVGEMRQGFHRFADEPGARGCIVEVVERPGVERVGLWGLVCTVDDDLAALAASVSGEVLATPRDAVQPGRRICSIDRAAGHGVPLAFLTPDRR